MRGRLFTSLLFLVASVALMRCAGGNIESKQADPRLAPAQPNYTSELAQSMRDLDVELLEIRELLEAGEDVGGVRITEYQFTALEPTDNSMLVDGFQALSMAFAHHVAAFNAAPTAETYSAVVGGCEACHMRSCPGPLERIAKRYLSDDE